MWGSKNGLKGVTWTESNVLKIHIKILESPLISWRGQKTAYRPISGRDVMPRGLASASRPLEAKILWPRPRGFWPRPRPRGSGLVEAGAEATIIVIMILSHLIVVFTIDYMYVDCIDFRYFIIG